MSGNWLWVSTRVVRKGGVFSGLRAPKRVQVGVRHAIGMAERVQLPVDASEVEISTRAK